MIEIMDITCSTDISSCCSDYGIATYLNIIQNALKIVQVVVPIILIIMGTIQLIKLMTDPEDKGGKGKKAFINKFVAAVLVFTLPFIVNLILGLLPETFELSGCWESAKGIVDQMNSSTKYEVTHTDRKHKIKVDASDYKIVATKEESEETGQEIDTPSSAGQKVVNYAKKFVGNPYVCGGSSLTTGCDCSHFVYLILKNLDLYDGSYVTSSNWITKGKEVKGGLKNAQAGDVIVYDGHVGFYDGKKNLVEAKGKDFGITNDRKPTDCSHPLLGVRRFV